MGVYDYAVTTHDNHTKDLSDYRGSVLLIVNTASQCGLTPQYEGIEALYRRYHEQGLNVVGFPCDQFGHQEPGDNAAIQEFCRVNYGVTFPVMAKIEVNGEGADPLYQYLTALGDPAPIAWNFTKFLFDRTGQLIGRFEPRVEPTELTPAIEAALA